jgi:hypothetical protein
MLADNLRVVSWVETLVVFQVVDTSIFVIATAPVK